MNNVNENCRFMAANGRKCTALKELYCKKEPTKVCSFYKKAEAEKISTDQKEGVNNV